MIDKEIAEEYIKDNYERWVRYCLSAEDIAKENFIAGLKAGSQLDMVWHDYDAGEDCYEDTHEGRWIKREDGKSKWHDLRKDPNDLPENSPYFRDESIRVIGVIPLSENKCISLECRYDYSEKKWKTQEDYNTVKVIAWSKIPTFDMESIYDTESKKETSHN